MLKNTGKHLKAPGQNGRGTKSKLPDALHYFEMGPFFSNSRKLSQAGDTCIVYLCHICKSLGHPQKIVNYKIGLCTSMLKS